MESNSIYAHLYTGSVNGDDEQENAAEQKKLKVIPLRACDDEADCVYLLDDSHLLGNSRLWPPVRMCIDSAGVNVRFLLTPSSSKDRL